MFTLGVLVMADAGMVAAQTPEDTARALVVRVVNQERQPVEGAWVMLVGSTRRTVSDIRGQAVFLEVPFGLIGVHIQHPTYAERIDTVAVADTAVIVATVPLAEQLFELQPIVVEVETPRRHMERRTGFAADFHFSRSDIEEALDRSAVADIEQLIQRQAPAQIQIATFHTMTGPLTCVRYTRRLGARKPGCAKVAVDGVLLAEEEGAYTLRSLSLMDIESVGFLSPASASFRYGIAMAENGVVIVETRAGGGS